MKFAVKCNCILFYLFLLYAGEQFFKTGNKEIWHNCLTF